MKKILVLLTVLLMTLCLALPASAQEATALPAEDAAIVEAAVAEEAAEEPYTGLLSLSSMLAIGVLLIAMAACLWFSAKRVKWNATMIAKAALCVALSYILSLITMFRMPMGGSVTPAAMLPIILFTVAYGPLEGLLAGSVLGLLNLLINPYVIHPVQLLVDYPMAFGAVALACVGKALPLPERLKLPAAVLFGYLGRYIMAVLSGVVFFSEYAGEQGALVYSLVYNISYLGVEALICMALACIPGMHRLPEMMRLGRN